MCRAQVLKGTGYGKEVDLWSCGVILYLLVSGSLPFDSTERDVIIEKTMEGRVPLERKSFNDVSEECKSLIMGLLTVDVERRFTCSQALNHPWFRLRWNDRGERIVDSSSAPNTAPSSALSSAPLSPALPSSALLGHHTHNAQAEAPQLVSAPHLFFSNSSTTTGGVEVDSSNNGRGREEEEDEEEEADTEESESKDEVGNAGGLAEPGAAFRSRFINMADEEEEPDVSPSHSR